MSFPAHRPRRLRASARLRDWVAETRLSPRSLVQPLFVCPGKGVENPIAAIPGEAQLSADRAAARAAKLVELGISAAILFGIPSRKDATGSEAVDADGVVARAARAIKRAAPELIVIADVCLCEYTDHGHCGVLAPAASEKGERTVDNDATLDLLAREAVVFADAGCDIVAPSAMADGQVAALRDALDDAGHTNVAILAYAAKYASAFYGPFREAAGSAPAFGDRRAYQMDPRNSREALREAALDVEEGADIIMVKPALPCLDIVARIRESFDLPVAAYHVSGEYAMIHAAAERGWVDRDGALLESLTAIHRAGADIIVSYGAERIAEALR
ncbi:MAG: porphobilinogen synthase [Planctomycetes bacterium]|nr:porphobilinogen synthase [Planctomycetota bacterium]